METIFLKMKRKHSNQYWDKATFCREGVNSTNYYFCREYNTFFTESSLLVALCHAKLSKE